MGTSRTAFEILAAVKRSYTGARGHFVMARLSLKTQTDLASLTLDDTRQDVADRLAEAVREICPDVKL